MGGRDGSYRGLRSRCGIDHTFSLRRRRVHGCRQACGITRYVDGINIPVGTGVSEVLTLEGHRQTGRRPRWPHLANIRAVGNFCLACAIDLDDIDVWPALRSGLRRKCDPLAVRGDLRI